MQHARAKHPQVSLVRAGVGGDYFGKSGDGKTAGINFSRCQILQPADTRARPGQRQNCRQKNVSSLAYLSNKRPYPFGPNNLVQGFVRWSRFIPDTLGFKAACRVIRSTRRPSFHLCTIHGICYPSWPDPCRSYLGCGSPSELEKMQGICDAIHPASGTHPFLFRAHRR